MNKRFWWLIALLTIAGAVAGGLPEPEKATDSITRWTASHTILVEQGPELPATHVEELEHDASILRDFHPEGRRRIERVRRVPERQRDGRWRTGQVEVQRIGLLEECIAVRTEEAQFFNHDAAGTVRLDQEFEFAIDPGD